MRVAVERRAGHKQKTSDLHGVTNYARRNGARARLLEPMFRVSSSGSA
jgi:hypothetical protein